MHRRNLCMQATIEQLNFITAINLEENVKMQVIYPDATEPEETAARPNLGQRIWNFIYIKVATMFMWLIVAFFICRKH